jgi:2-polyprenyl-3-methyl-5-hydroxy-6-metoxy-1,4-benzoquinol methylase
VTALLKLGVHDSSEIVGIDLVSHNVAKENLKHLPNVEVFQHDLLSSPISLGKFDFIYCHEVLHHTTDPRTAFLNISYTLKDSSSKIAIYV